MLLLHLKRRKYQKSCTCIAYTFQKFICIVYTLKFHNIRKCWMNHLKHRFATQTSRPISYQSLGPLIYLRGCRSGFSISLHLFNDCIIYMSSSVWVPLWDNNRQKLFTYGSLYTFEIKWIEMRALRQIFSNVILQYMGKRAGLRLTLQNVFVLLFF